MNIQKIKNDKNHTDYGAKKFVATIVTLIGVVLFFIAFITFVLWLATKNLFQ